MDEQTNPPTMIEVCTIRIGFPVESDDEAIAYKKKIAEILSPIPKARIEFALNTVPVPLNENAR